MTKLFDELKLAVELEEKGYEFYKNTALNTNNPLAVATLTSLAERELLHLARVKEYYESITRSKAVNTNWLNSVSMAPSKQALLTPILERLKAGLNMKFETKKEVNNAYKIAEGLEKDSYTLYDKLASEQTDESAKKFFKALSLEENEHYAILDETLEYLNNPGEWYRLQEKWIVEG
ncbi:ferritin family protein [Candidatus Saganbacteria bacterium]|nr:ferritin family protein [Candidatus Saganbacteria bacterium]